MGSRRGNSRPVSKRVRAELTPLPSFDERTFGEPSKAKPFGCASAALTGNGSGKFSTENRLKFDLPPRFEGWQHSRRLYIDIREGKKGVGKTMDYVDNSYLYRYLEYL